MSDAAKSDGSAGVRSGGADWKLVAGDNSKV